MEEKKDEKRVEQEIAPIEMNNGVIVSFVTHHWAQVRVEHDVAIVVYSKGVPVHTKLEGRSELTISFHYKHCNSYL